MSKPIITPEQLSDHKLVQAILADSLPIMKLQHEGKKYSELSEAQQVLYETGRYLGQVLNQLDRIEQASILNDSYPNIKAWRKRFGQFQYFQYHLENYFQAVMGAVDRLLLLINHMYGLGAVDRLVRMKGVIEGLQKLGQDDLAKLVASLQQEFKELKTVRDKTTHMERFQDKQLWHIGLIEHSLKEKTIPDEEGFLAEDLKYYIKEYRSRRHREMNGITTSFMPLVSDVFDELNKYYGAKK